MRLSVRRNADAAASNRRHAKARGRPKNRLAAAPSEWRLCFIHRPDAGSDQRASVTAMPPPAKRLQTAADIFDLIDKGDNPTRKGD
jgi:hypothetical protein